MCVLLFPLLQVELSSPFEDILGCSDASKIGLGVLEAKVGSPKEIQQLASRLPLKISSSTTRLVSRGVAIWYTPQTCVVLWR